MCENFYLQKLEIYFSAENLRDAYIECMNTYIRNISALIKRISKIDAKIKASIEQGTDYKTLRREYPYKSRLIFEILRNIHRYSRTLPCYEDFITQYCEGDTSLCDAPAYLRHKRACELIKYMCIGKEYLESLPERRLRIIVEDTWYLSCEERIKYFHKIIPIAYMLEDNSSKSTNPFPDNQNSNVANSNESLMDNPLDNCEIDVIEGGNSLLDNQNLNTMNSVESLPNNDETKINEFINPINSLADNSISKNENSDIPLADNQLNNANESNLTAIWKPKSMPLLLTCKNENI